MTGVFSSPSVPFRPADSLFGFLYKDAIHGICYLFDYGDEWRFYAHNIHQEKLIFNSLLEGSASSFSTWMVLERISFPRSPAANTDVTAL